LETRGDKFGALMHPEIEAKAEGLQPQRGPEARMADSRR
jgi:hypothetical protein